MNNQLALFCNPSEQKAIFLSILSGVADLHKNGIIHRDLKPENILMNSIEDIAICDLGFSKDLNASSSFTSTGDVFGTRNYMSPEQCIDSKNVDLRTDIYALGQILNDLVGRMWGNSPRQINQIADKATAYNRENRYCSIEEFRHDIIVGYEIWLREDRGMAVKQMIDSISKETDRLIILEYADRVNNNEYYKVGDAEDFLSHLEDEQYKCLESDDEKMCLNMFEHIWDDFRNTWNGNYNRIDDMASLVKYYWDISQSPDIKGYLLGNLANIAKEGNRYSAMSIMADLISGIASEPEIKKALLMNTSINTIKSNYKIISKPVPVWL